MLGPVRAHNWVRRQAKEVSAVVIEDEYVTRLRTMVDGLPDVDLDRLGRCDGPRILVQLDGGGCR